MWIPPKQNCNPVTVSMAVGSITKPCLLPLASIALQRPVLNVYYNSENMESCPRSYTTIRILESY